MNSALKCLIDQNLTQLGASSNAREVVAQEDFEFMTSASDLAKSSETQRQMKKILITLKS